MPHKCRNSDAVLDSAKAQKLTLAGRQDAALHGRRDARRHRQRRSFASRFVACMECANRVEE